jgi:hypothetical protein
LKILLFICILIAAVTVEAKQLIRQSDVTKIENTIEEGQPTSEVLNVSFYPKEGIVINGKFSITSKGNGSLEIGGLSIRIYDAHEDGVTFENFLLSTNIYDINGDGYLDLEVSGNAVITDEETEETVAKKPVKAQFIYDPVNKKLIQTLSSEYLVVDKYLLPATRSR